MSLLALIFIPVLELGSVSNAGKYFYSGIQLHLAGSQGMNKVHKSILELVSVVIFLYASILYKQGHPRIAENSFSLLNFSFCIKIFLCS